MQQYTLEQFVIDWKKGPISAFLLAVASDIMGRDDLTPESRVHMVVSLVSARWLEHVASKNRRKSEIATMWSEIGKILDEHPATRIVKSVGGRGSRHGDLFDYKWDSDDELIELIFLGTPQLLVKRERERDSIRITDLEKAMREILEHCKNDEIEQIRNIAARNLAAPKDDALNPN